MKSVIEKLGIKTPDELKIVGDVWKVYELAGLPRPHVGNDKFFEQGSQLKKILDDKNEMLEALIDRCIWMESHYTIPIRDIEIIEKATGKTWAEIKELL